MDSTVTPTSFEFPTPLEVAPPGLGAMVYSSVGPIRPSLGRRASRALARFLIVSFIGVGATLAWQSYGDAARAMIANSWPQLGWLVPQTAPLAQTIPNVAAPPTAETTISPDLQQFAAALASLRQSLDQLAAQVAAGQRQVTDDIAKLQADEQKILRKVSAAPPRADAAPAHKPTPPTAPPSPSAPLSPSAQAR